MGRVWPHVAPSSKRSRGRVRVHVIPWNIPRERVSRALARAIKCMCTLVVFPP